MSQELTRRTLCFLTSTAGITFVAKLSGEERALSSRQKTPKQMNPITDVPASPAVAGLGVLTWRDQQFLPEGVSGGAFAVVAGKLLYSGGTTWRNSVKHWLSETHIYTPETGIWTPGPHLPERLAYGASLRINQSVEILGGANESGISRNCWRFDPDKNAWLSSGILPEGSVFATAETVQGEAYLFGGCPDQGDLSHCSNSVWKREDAKHWTIVAEMPQGRIAMPATVSVQDRIYLFGGCSQDAASGIRNHNEAYCFDPRHGHWTALRPLPVAVRGTSAVAIDTRYILLVGGYTNAAADSNDLQGGFTAASYLYDREQDRYQPVTALPRPVMGMEILRQGDTIWGAGGEDRNRSRTPQLVEGSFLK